MRSLEKTQSTDPNRQHYSLQCHPYLVHQLTRKKTDVTFLRQFNDSTINNTQQT